MKKNGQIKKVGRIQKLKRFPTDVGVGLRPTPTYDGHLPRTVIATPDIPSLHNVLPIGQVSVQ